MIIDPIQPIRETDEVVPAQSVTEKAASTAPAKTPLVNPTATPAQAGAKSATSVTGADGRPVDVAKLQKSPDYYLTTMSYMMDKARMYYNNMQYDSAQFWYKQLFLYLPFYRPTYSQLVVDFTPLVFNYTWMTRIIQGKEEALKLMNQDLLKILEPVAQSTKAEMRPVQEVITDLQALGRLPQPARPDTVVTPQTLEQVAERLALQGAAMISAQVYRHLEVRLMIDAQRAGERASRVLGGDERPQIQPYAMLPFGFRQTGVPIAASMPQTQEMALRLSPKTVPPEWWTGRVDPVYGLNKDPQEGQNRRRRQKRADAVNKKSRMKLPKKPQGPEITF